MRAHRTGPQLPSFLAFLQSLRGQFKGLRNGGLGRGQVLQEVCAQVPLAPPALCVTLGKSSPFLSLASVQGAGASGPMLAVILERVPLLLQRFPARGRPESARLESGRSLPLSHASGGPKACCGDRRQAGLGAERLASGRGRCRTALAFPACPPKDSVHAAGGAGAAAG